MLVDRPAAGTELPELGTFPVGGSRSIAQGDFFVPVRYDTIGRVAVITIDRPERRNAVDRATADALHEAWRRFDADESVDVGVLYGAGGTFSAGADLKAFDLEDRPEGWLGFTRLQVAKPTIAAIEGHCVAGGLEMALWCDMRVAGSSAVFGCFERRFGVPLVDGGTQRLPRIVGEGIAMEMILTGRAVDAEEAYVIGLANLVVEDGKALEAAVRLGRSLCAFPQATLRSDRKAVLDGADLPLEEGLAVERRYGARVLDAARDGAERFAAGEGRGGAAVRGSRSSASWRKPVVGGPVTLEVGGEEIPTHVARPAASRRPAVLVVHDRWGFDELPRRTADQLAAAGFHAVAVGLFDPPVGRGSEAADRLVESMERVRIEAILEAALDLVRALPDVSGSPAVLGYGVGGGLAMALASSQPDISACVAYTPISPWAGITPDFEGHKTAVLGHYGALDDRASPHTAYQLEMQLRARGIDVTFETYRRAGPEFYRPDRHRFHDPDATELAWSRTVAFLRRVS